MDTDKMSEKDTPKPVKIQKIRLGSMLLPAASTKLSTQSSKPAAPTTLSTQSSKTDSPPQESGHKNSRLHLINNKRSNDSNEVGSEKRIKFSPEKRKGLSPCINAGSNNSNIAENSREIEQVINKLGSKLTDLMIHSLLNMKQHGILSVTFNIPQDTISVSDSEGTLVLHPIRYADLEDGSIAHYNYINSLEGYNVKELGFDASYNNKKKFKEICPVAISVAKDLHILLNIFLKLPQNPPMRDKTVFSKKEYYRKALLEHLEMIHKNNQNFQFFKGTKRVELNHQINVSSLESDTKVSIKVQEGSYYSIDSYTDNFKDIATKLAENIYQSVIGEINEQINREMSRRKELRFHVEMYKAYIRLQALCALNLSRNQGETTKSQAKALVVKYFPHISLENMNLMLQRAPRIYRLLLLSSEDWRLIDSFEELSSCFFKSSMRSAANFEIWLNLVKTGIMVSYDEGPTMLERGRKCMKEAKIEIIKSYFDGVNEDLKDFIIDDDDE